MAMPLTGELPGTPRLHAPRLPRELGVGAMVAIIFFSVSGGPFGLEDAISSAGPGMALLMILVVPLLLGIPNALMAAELGAALPLEGGYYYWIKLALGRPAAVVFGSWEWMNTFLDTALYPLFAADYLSLYIPGTTRGQHALFTIFDGAFSIDTHWLLAIAIMIPLAYLNARGSKVVGESSVLLMVLVLLPFAILTVIGLAHLATSPHPDPLTPFTLPHQGSGAAFGAALGVVIYNFIGWEDPSTVLGEVRTPQRTYGRALLISLPLITLCYLLPMIAALGSGLHAGHPDAWTDGDFANAGGLLAGSWLRVSITVGAILGNVGLFSALLMSGSRVPRTMAGDGYLPRSLGTDSPRYGTPVRAIVVSCVFFAVFCSLDFEALLDADVITDLACILLAFASLLVLRRRFPNMRRPYRIRGGWPFLTLMLVGPLVFTGWLFESTYADEPAAFWIGVIVLAIGLAVYPITKRLIKRGSPDQAVDASMIDLGDGRDAAALLS